MAFCTTPRLFCPKLHLSSSPLLTLPEDFVLPGGYCDFMWALFGLSPSAPQRVGSWTAASRPGGNARPIPLAMLLTTTWIPAPHHLQRNLQFLQTAWRQHNNSGIALWWAAHATGAWRIKLPAWTSTGLYTLPAALVRSPSQSGLS